MHSAPVVCESLLWVWHSGEISCRPGARGTSMTPVSSLDRSERPAARGGARPAHSTARPGPEAAGPTSGRLTLRRSECQSRDDVLYQHTVSPNRAPTWQHSTLSEQTGSRRRPRSRRVLSGPRRTREPRVHADHVPRHAHMHHVVYLLCLALALSLARHSCSRRHTRRCPGAVHVLSLSHTRDRPSLAPSLTSRPRSHRRRRRWCRRCRRSRSRLRRSRHRSRRCGDGCPHPWLG